MTVSRRVRNVGLCAGVSIFSMILAIHHCLIGSIISILAVAAAFYFATDKAYELGHYECMVFLPVSKRWKLLQMEYPRHWIARFCARLFGWRLVR